MPEMGYRPTNKYLPPRSVPSRSTTASARRMRLTPKVAEGGFLGWLDRVLYGSLRRARIMKPAPSIIGFTTVIRPRLRHALRAVCIGAAFRSRPDRRGGSASPVSFWRSDRSPQAFSPRPFISVIPSAPGARSANGEAPGFRARACWRYLTYIPAALAVGRGLDLCR